MGIPLHKGFVFGDGFFHRSALVRFEASLGVEHFWQVFYVNWHRTYNELQIP